MGLASIMGDYLGRYKTRYGHTTTPAQWSALNAILGCRNGQYGEVLLACNHCAWQDHCPQSCGHRSCNQCQQHSATQWLERQKAKLLPVDYFMVTVTLPYELRALAQAHQKRIYTLLFRCAISVLKDFGVNDKGLAAELAMTAVLHTHTRRLDYHPHLHIIVPGGGVNQARNEWCKLKGKYLFNGCQLAAVFRGRMLAGIAQAGLRAPRTPSKWVVQCTRVGRGLPALKYLSCYLYRGVISDNNILADDGAYVTFQYRDSRTGTFQTRRERGEDFVALILQHTLPKGFRRTRDYGFLHGNAKRLLRLVQWVLQVMIPTPETSVRPCFRCKRCQHPMTVTGFIRPHPSPG